MRNQLVILITVLSLNLGLSQEQTYSFTLDEAIQFALENNYAAINANRDIIDAQKQKWETIAGGLPQINGSVGYQNQLKQPVTLLPAELVGGAAGEFIPVVFSQPQSLTATATLTQQIFDGSYIVGVQATKAFLSYSANNKEKTELDVRKQVVEAYGNVLLAEESVKILEKNKANLEKNLYETTKLYENGLGDEESVDQLQITLSSIENRLQNALRLKEITLQMLNVSLGLDLNAPTQLQEKLEDLTVSKMDLSILSTAFNISDNVDYKLAENLNEQRYYEWKLSRSRALPTLNAFVNYGSSSYSESFDFFSGDPEWFDSSILGFDLNIPIFSSLKRSASTQRAKIALEKAKTQLTEAEQQIRLQLENAKNDYTLAINNYETAKQNLLLSERIENKNQIKYKEGLATSFELRQAQTQLYTTQQEFLQSMVEVINKKTDLEIILNTKS
ncbi:TolC family protein [Maribacter sp. 6B07]|uniref:Outer membrane protein TolC n=1 Tax=Maribacter dokdonensis TaxID=320912 RepID=A0A1H4LNU6_9FLAO|nr:MULTISPECIES: TolC family protein [Maribacter]MDP2526510.1 TolC family protein [Maribacter dokdonensis]PHN94757.1 TolC family protein [Maribacter sp. 6B07]CAG2531659.1 Outer membrane protein TolC [Maribacter dokdonensis]SEB72380.1 Outer membrane protein TolC [Maribacter dokdonensis]